MLAFATAKTCWTKSKRLSECRKMRRTPRCFVSIVRTAAHVTCAKALALQRG